MTPTEFELQIARIQSALARAKAKDRQWKTTKKGVSMEPVPAILDERQLERIESVHRGFLYQHLYAAGCLLLAEQAGFTAMSVERDEDIELANSNGRSYIQVKTRSAPIMPRDINEALERFALIRAEHEDGRRPGDARFFLAVNQQLGPTLRAAVDNAQLPNDLQILWPGRQDIPHTELPPTYESIQEGLSWCTAKAQGLPFSMLSPESLIWKLAGLIQHISAGGFGYEDHTVETSQLPTLFEQTLNQLQEFPAPPLHYRSQSSEPDFDLTRRARIICGFSGAGKTAWAAKAALHTTQPCVYLDVGDLPGPALSRSLVRELASRFANEQSSEVRKIFAPGAGGLESLRTLDTYLGTKTLSPIAVIDNAHRIPAADLRGIVESTTHLRCVFLCQPTRIVQELEASLGIEREVLSGWDVDTVAATVAEMGASGSADGFVHLRKITGGLPLFVIGAISNAIRDNAGNVDRLCATIEAQTHVVKTAQEIILTNSFESLPEAIKAALSVMSISDIALTADEFKKILIEALKVDDAEFAGLVRQLRPLGLLEIFGGARLKVHDAIRVLSTRYLSTLEPRQVTYAYEALKNLLFLSLIKDRDVSRFSLYLKTLVELHEVRTIVSLTTEELFHEMGITTLIRPSLEKISQSVDEAPIDRFWALDALLFSDFKTGSLDSADQLITQMGELLEKEKFGTDEENAHLIKKIYWMSQKGDADQTLALLGQLAENLPDAESHHRVLRYTAALTLWRLKRYDVAETIVREVIYEYFEAIGIKPLQIIGKNAPDIIRAAKKYPRLHEDIKHLADSLELCAVILKDQEREPGLLRIHAMKLYEIVGAVDSFVRVGQDSADDCVAFGDYEGAKTQLEQFVLPMALNYGMADRILAVRSQYAVVLALQGNIEGARHEMDKLQAYESGMSDMQRAEIKNQKGYIAQLAKNRAQLPPPGYKKTLLNRKFSALAMLCGLEPERLSFLLRSLRLLEITNQPADITLHSGPPALDVRLKTMLGAEEIYAADEARYCEQLQNIELSNGQTIKISEIWTINPMPQEGFTQAELDTVDLSEAEKVCGPNGETLRKMISDTYHCKNIEEEDFFIRRFIAS